MRLPVSIHVITVVAFAAALVPSVRGAALGVRAINEPAARADVELEHRVTPELFSKELEAALQADDLDLAESFAELAQERGVALGPEQQDRLDAMRADGWGRAARDFRDGFTQSELRSGMAISGAIAADLSGFGDLRDVAREGGKWVEGKEADMLVLGLSAAGLAVTAAAWGSLGAALPARGGLSVIKGLQKSGRLSRSFALGLTRVAGEALDRDALKASLGAAGRFEFSAARLAGGRFLRPAAVAELRQVGGDVSTIYRSAGARGAQDVLSMVESSSEVRMAARLAVAKGGKTRAILKLLGRGVMLAGSLSLALAAWLLTFVTWFFAAASAARRLGERIGRALFC